MVKERLIEQLGEPPVWTMGWGGSGGAIQQNMIAQNYPGLLDGIVPALTFQDAQLGEPVDCRLINRYFAGSGAPLNTAQRRAIHGYISPFTCPAWDSAFANVIVASLGCNSIVPTADRYNAVTNPTGARCTTWDSMVNVYGRDPATGFARRTLDNVGVQYGLKALQEGVITTDRFLDLNEKIGGYDNDGNPRAARAVADPEALAIAYRTGRVNQAAGGLPDVPILDLRPYSDNAVDIHTYIHSFIMRERLRQVLGSAANQVMWRAAGGGTAPMTAAARSLMADWLDAIEADGSDRPLSEKVVAAKPATGVDACWTGAGVRIDDPAEVNGTGPLHGALPAGEHTSPASRSAARLDGAEVPAPPGEPERLPGAEPGPGGEAARRLPGRRLRLHAAGRRPAARSGDLAVLRVLSVVGRCGLPQRPTCLFREPPHQLARGHVGRQRVGLPGP